MSGKVKIVRTDLELECPLVDRHFVEAGAELVLLPDGVGEDELAAQVADADLLLMCYTPVTARVLEGAARLKGIVKYGVGIDAIDIEAARARRIPVVNIPEYAEETVAEGAFALMIALARRLVPLDRAMSADGWAWPEAKWLASRHRRKDRRHHRSRPHRPEHGAHGRRRLPRPDPGVDPGKSAAEMAAAGIEKVDELHEMLAQCDFVSIHSVLKPETHHLIGGAELEAMKPTGILINSARGAIVDEMALLAVLKEGRIAGAGLDVFSQEPLALDGHPLSELFAMDNVILTPHLTFYTAEPMQRMEEETLERCAELLGGGPVLVTSRDARLRAQEHGVVFAD